MSSSCQTQAWCPNSSSDSWSTELEAERGSPEAQHLLISTLHSAAGWTPSWGGRCNVSPFCSLRVEWVTWPCSSGFSSQVNRIRHSSATLGTVQSG